MFLKLFIHLIRNGIVKHVFRGYKINEECLKRMVISRLHQYHVELKALYSFVRVKQEKYHEKESSSMQKIFNRQRLPLRYL